VNAKEVEEIVQKHGCWLRGLGGERAVLSNAVLSNAVLSNADLSNAVLSNADLSNAVLSNADLRGAVLLGAVLRGADLSGAVLLGAVLRGADLSNAVLLGAVLLGADLSGADLRGAVLSDGIPKIERLHSKILAAIESGGSLEMCTWHTCETTHCRAGWAIQIAGEFGRGLEWALGSSAAGALLFAVAYPDQKVPDFYASNDYAMADIRRCAAEENLGSSPERVVS